MNDIVFIKGNLKALAISGLWDFYQPKSPLKQKLFKIYGYVISLFYMCHFITVFTEMISLISDIPLFMENATITLLSCMTLVKNGTFLFRKNQIEGLLQQMKFAETISYGKNRRQVEIYDKCVRRGRLFSKAYWLMCFLMLSGIVRRTFVVRR